MGEIGVVFEEGTLDPDSLEAAVDEIGFIGAYLHAQFGVEIGDAAHASEVTEGVRVLELLGECGCVNRGDI